MKNKNINNNQRRQQLHGMGDTDMVDLVQRKLVKTTKPTIQEKKISSNNSLSYTQIRIQIYYNILSKILSIQENIMQSHAEKQESVTYSQGRKPHKLFLSGSRCCI